METGIFLILLSLIAIYILIDHYLEKYRELRIIFSGVIISTFIFIISRNINDDIISKIFNSLSIISFMITVLIIIIIYVGKMTNNNDNE